MLQRYNEIVLGRAVLTFLTANETVLKDWDSGKNITFEKRSQVVFMIALVHLIKLTQTILDCLNKKSFSYVHFKNAFRLSCKIFYISFFTFKNYYFWSMFCLVMELFFMYLNSSDFTIKVEIVTLFWQKWTWWILSIFLTLVFMKK